MYKPKLLIFDINETILDLKKIEVEIQTLLDDQTSFSLWFSTLLQYSMVESITNHYHNFANIGKATLWMTAQKLGKDISDNDINRILSLFTQLPAHSEVIPALAKLKDQNYKIVALTNGSSEALKAQMAHAGLENYFERLFSVEEVKSYKPQAKAYKHVLKILNTKPQEAMMIAAHPWDIAGAKAVGMKTAFISREGQIYYPLMEKADIVVKDLTELLTAVDLTFEP